MIITITNAKGGQGKTTTAFNLAAYLTAAGKKVLAVDMDGQASLSFLAGISDKDLNDDNKIKVSIYDIITDQKKPVALKTKYFDLIAGDCRLATLTENIKSDVLKNQLKQLDYDFIIIDTQPVENVNLRLTATAADKIIIPMMTDFLSLRGVRSLSNSLSLLNKQIDAIFLNCYHANRTNDKMIRNILDDDFQNKVLNNTLPDASAIREAGMLKQSIFDYSGKSKAAASFTAIFEELKLI